MNARPRRLSTLVLGIVLCLPLGAVWCSFLEHPSQISRDFRDDEVDPMFARFQKGDVRYKAKLDLLGSQVEAVVVDEARGADYGFIKVEQPIAHCWFMNDEYTLKRYDDHHVFVIISDRHAARLRAREAPSDR